MDYCYEYLSYHRNFNSFLGLPFFVNRDFRNKHEITYLFSYLYQYFTEFMTFTSLISSILAVPLVWDDMNVLCGCLSSLTHIIQVSSKTIILKIYKDRFLNHLKKMDKILHENDEFRIYNDEIPNFEKFYRAASKYIRICHIISFVLACIMSTTYFSPFVYRSLVYYDDLDHQFLPIVGYIPFEYRSVPLFQLVTMYQTICFYILNLKTVVMDSFLLGMIVLHTTNLRYLNLILQKVMKRGNYTETFLKKWILQYAGELEELKTFKSLISTLLLIEYGYILIHTCIPAFVITSTLSWTLNQKIALVIITTSSLAVFYLLSSSGDDLTTANEELAWTFYGSHLFTKTTKFYQLAHKMLLFRIRIRPLAFSVNTLFPLCASTFAHILRLVYTYYMALNEIQKMKN